MITADQRRQLAPLVGEIVLRFAVLEGETARLADLAYRQSGEPAELRKQAFSERIGPLRARLEHIGAQQAALGLEKHLGLLSALNRSRNDVVHGIWFWDLSQGAVGTRNTDRAGGDEEFRVWRLKELKELAQDIQTATALMRQLSRRVEGLRRGVEDRHPVKMMLRPRSRSRR